MKEKKKLKPWFLGMGILAFVLAVGLLIYIVTHYDKTMEESHKTVQAVPLKLNDEISGADEWSTIEHKEQYLYGETITVPECTVDVDGRTIATESVLVYPSGKTTTLKEAKLSESGVYRLRYTAIDKGEAYTKDYTFSVADPAYMCGEDSTASYQTLQGTYNDSTDGLLVKLKAADTLTFTQLIDVSQLTADNLLFEGFVVPEVKGEKDFSRLVITLTDSVDESCYVKIAGRQTDGIEAPFTYWQAAGDNQKMSGREGTAMHVETMYGTAAVHSFYGDYYQWAQQDVPLGQFKSMIAFDYAEKKITTTGTEVCDLDNPEDFTALWKGFPSGKVRVTIHAEEYVNTHATFIITKLANLDLTATTYSDAEGPQIHVQKEYETMPLAEVGRDYPVLDATAYDDYSGEENVKCEVYYNYASDRPARVQVTDGRFKTDLIGNYAMVYSATDDSGNVGEAIVWLTAQENVPDITAEIQNEVQTEAIAGHMVPFPQVVYLGGCGSTITPSVAVTCEGNPITTSKEGFRPTKAGTYTVTLTGTDYIRQVGEVSYEVKVAAGDRPILLEQPEFPLVYISGSDYKLPKMEATDFTGDEVVEKPVTIEITDATGTYEKKAGESFTPTVTSNGDVVSFKIKSDGKEIGTYEVKVIMPFEKVSVSGITMPWLMLENYFLGADFAIEKSAEDITLTALKDGTIGWTFARELLAEKFEFVFDGITGKTQFKELQIILQDSKNKDTALEVLIRNNGADDTEFEVKNNDITKSRLKFSSDDEEKFSFGYQNNTVTLGDAAIEVTKTANGEEFSGFESGYVYMTVNMIGAEQGAAYRIYSVNGHMTNFSETDRIKPKIVLMGEYSSSASVGDKVVIPAAMAADVLDPKVDFYLTVVNPEGNAVVDMKGKKLENVSAKKAYTIIPEEVGQYLVTYTAKPTERFGGGENSFNFAINSEDEDGPKLTFDGEFKKKAKVGDKIMLPKIEVSDKYSKKEDIIVDRYVVTPNGELIKITSDANGVLAKSEGAYEFRIYARDAVGNVTMVRKPVKVTK